MDFILVISDAYDDKINVTLQLLTLAQPRPTTVSGAGCATSAISAANAMTSSSGGGAWVDASGRDGGGSGRFKCGACGAVADDLHQRRQSPHVAVWNDDAETDCEVFQRSLASQYVSACTSCVTR